MRYLTPPLHVALRRPGGLVPGRRVRTGACRDPDAGCRHSDPFGIGSAARRWHQLGGDGSGVEPCQRQPPGSGRGVLPSRLGPGGQGGGASGAGRTYDIWSPAKPPGGRSRPVTAPVVVTAGKTGWARRGVEPVPPGLTGRRRRWLYSGSIRFPTRHDTCIRPSICSLSCSSSRLVSPV
jgi:hypothetical protein